MTAAQRKSSDFWLALERFADTSRNWDLFRSYQASLAERREGFTEVFHEDHELLQKEACWKQEVESVEMICATPHPSNSAVSIRLLQYRAAWMEQLALRVAGLPHVVVNSPYAVTEACGQLPLLQDFSGTGGDNDTAAAAAAPPAMTGRMNHHHEYYQNDDETTTTTKSSGNAILDYLATARGVQLDQALSTTRQRQQSMLYQTLIRQQLEPCRAVLQFQNDEAWNQIHRVRCLQAAKGARASYWGAAFQARSERLYERSRLPVEYRALDTPQAMKRARAAYRVLEDELVLQQQQEPNSPYLLGTSQPTLVDVLLWDHLMHALIDVHLVVVLADFPALIQFVQRIWNKYFALPNTKNIQQDEEDWRVWNAQQNAANAFCQVPSLVANDTHKGGAAAGTFRHAIDLMEQLFVRERNLGESVLVAKQARSLQQQQQRANLGDHRPFETWNRWRMGGPLYAAPKESSASKQERPDLAGQQEEKIRTEYKRNDELWVSTVAVGTVLCMLFFGLAKPQQ